MLEFSRSGVHPIARLIAILVFLSLFVNSSFAVSSTRTILAKDDCEPVSFNAAIGPGTCNPAFGGSTTFAEFIAELKSHQIAAAWQFSPNTIGVVAGQTLIILSAGGEVHTFTKVAAFGGGFIIPLNILSGNPVPRPECTTGAVVIPGEVLQAQPPSATNLFVESGDTESITTGTAGSGATLPPGSFMFQCCIHPWMRAIVTVSA